LAAVKGDDMNKVGLLLCAASLCAAAAWGAEMTSENDTRLKRYLERFPKADANEDGVLTRDEFREFRGANRGPRSPAIKPDLVDVKYGPHERQVVDFWKAKSDTPAPVLIYFHGGGFMGGNKTLHGLQLNALDKGVSAVSATYRLVRDPNVTVRDCMVDAGRVIQFVRSKAKEWNIDPTRIALTGNSAGASMSMWLAMHDDLADPESDDPVARLSTRVTCATVFAGPTTFDPTLILKHVGGDPKIHSSWPLMFKIKSIDELNMPERRALVAECSPMHHATEDDPPLLLGYGPPPPEVPYPADTNTSTSIHSARFGLLLKEKLDELGVECHVQWKGNRNEESQIDFLLRHFRM
jgi:hypothetical protein